MTARITPIPERMLDQLSVVCPSCDHMGIFNYARGIVLPTKNGDVEYSIWICPNPQCHEPVLFVSDAYNRILDSYPKRVPKLDPAVPVRVTSDMVEAYKSYNAGAWRASASMGRRALQNSVLERGATEEKLRTQIDELYKRNIITKDIRDWAHEIRLTGNDGAHPDKDGLQDVTQPEAKELLEFLEKYTDYVYVMPTKVAEARRKRNAAKKQSA